MTTPNEQAIHEALQTRAVGEGIVDVDAIKMVDASQVRFNKDGTVEGADEAIANLKAEKPYLFSTISTTSHVGGVPRPAGVRSFNALDLSPAEYAAAKRRLGGR